MSKNTNCLAGLSCPQCGQNDMLKIVGVSTFEVADDGTGNYNDVNWGDNSTCTCPSCGHSNIVAAFRVGDATASATDILNELIDDIEESGGVISGRDGGCHCYKPKGCKEWHDLGLTYVKACVAMKRKPVIEKEE